MSCEFIGWCTLRPEVQAAWVQAIGSIAAIIIAVLVPMWNRDAEVTARKKKEDAEALALATVMVREMERLRSGVDLERLKAANYTPESRIEINMKLIPQALWSNALDLPRLGDAGERALRAIYSVHRARDYASGGVVLGNDIRSYAIHLNHASEHANAALTALRHMLD